MMIGKSLNYMTAPKQSYSNPHRLSMQPVHPDRNPVHRNQVKASPRRVHSPTRFLNLQPHGSMEALLSRAFSTQSKEKLLLPGYPISKAAVFFKAAASVYGFAGFTHISFITLMYIHIDLGAVYSILVNTNY